eukprot:UN10304
MINSLQNQVKSENTVHNINSSSLITLFVNRLICSYIGNDGVGVSEDITNVIGRFIINKTTTIDNNICTVRQIHHRYIYTPFAVLCCLYNIENHSDETICKITNSLQQREILKSDGSSTPIQILGVINGLIASQTTQNENMEMQLLLAALLQQYFCDIEALKYTAFCHFTSKQICLSLLCEIVSSTTKCDTQ